MYKIYIEWINKPRSEGSSETVLGVKKSRDTHTTSTSLNKIMWHEGDQTKKSMCCMIPGI